MSSTSTACELKPGRVPLLISMPHVGTAIPADQQHRYQPRALETEDTDWHLARLYGELAESLGASLLVPHYSRYLIDLNRPPDDAPMYPGASNTELCPTRFFTGEPLYLEGQAPDAAERLRRRELYWQPYHQALSSELQRLKGEHGYALLFDAHSIRSELPWLFEGRLPDLNLGTADGKSCDAAITRDLGEVLARQSRYSEVVNGRFKGGYITRHYGRPDQGQHAVQLEMCQCCYMQEARPFAYDQALAEHVQPLLQSLLERLLAWRPAA
ncbi:MAG: N-formylglutamate deformylase [Burkholderiaceae bacterium]|nr:N-formylglutamate deformylase [Roseateles sp.]MBV8471367.1 N-formylglutamate deformylase [Burkholderiaceae bacterium]